MSVTTSVDGDEIEHAIALDHCTLVPGQGVTPGGEPVDPAAVVLASSSACQGSLELAASRCILGRLDLQPGAPGFEAKARIADSIVDGTGDSVPALRCARAELERVTVLGATQVRELHASDSIFSELVEVERTQLGCVRYSYAPHASRLPRAYRCQPALALARVREAGGGAAEEASVLARMVPAFTSMRYRDPAYCQLAITCPPEIRTGASNGSEMGAYQHLAQPQREANLRASLEEYLRFGLEAGAFFVT